MSSNNDYSALLSVDPDAVTEAPLKALYTEKIIEMKQKHLTATHIDSGFDLFVPSTTVIQPGKIALIDMKVRCAVYIGSELKPSPYCLYPRSSVCKRGIMLANSVGIIDSGYRGNLMGMFDVQQTDNSSYILDKNTRLVQICAPNLMPIRAVLVDSIDDLGITERGAGGFGSTGK